MPAWWPTASRALAAHLAEDAKRREIESLLSGEADANDAYLEMNAGAGGTEAQDWAEMLHAHVSCAGPSSTATRCSSSRRARASRPASSRRRMQVTGPNAYGWLKTEAGVHRLVRISPFDANARRQTSFASVWVYPVVDDTIEIEINEADLKVDTYRASRRRRPARQQDRKRDPHHPHPDRHHRRLPDRPQPAPQPRDRDGDAEGAAVRGASCRSARRCRRRRRAAKTDIGWGHQIRSYVLAPYQLVKDLRTGVETRQSGTRCWTATSTSSWPPPWPPASAPRAARQAPPRVSLAFRSVARRGGDSALSSTSALLSRLSQVRAVSIPPRHARRRPSIHAFACVTKARRGWHAFACHDGSLGRGSISDRHALAP